MTEVSLIKKINRKAKRKLNYIFNDVKNAFGLNEALFRNSVGARILVYHGLCKKDHTRFNSIFLTTKMFESHLQFYKKYFNVISLDDYYKEQFDEKHFNVCLTFDDGFANNYKYVLPLITKYNVPVTFFITGIRNAGYDILWNDFLLLAQKYGPSELQLFNYSFYKNRHKQYVTRSNGKSLREMLQHEDYSMKKEMISFFEPIVSSHKMKEEDYWLQMTEDEIRKLSASLLVTIGSHGYYHNDLSMVAINNVREEIVSSKKYLETIINKEVNAIAFPYGNYTREAVHEAKLAGFNQILATDFRCQEDWLDSEMRERMTVNPYMSINNQMTAIVKGKYE